MARKQTHLVDITTKTKKVVTRTFVRNKSRIALGVVVAAAAVTGGLAAVWVTTSVLVWTGLRAPVSGALTATSAAAVSGAYLWVVADLIGRWRYRDLSPADLWWSSWR